MDTHSTERIRGILVNSFLLISLGSLVWMKLDKMSEGELTVWIQYKMQKFRTLLAVEQGVSRGTGRVLWEAMETVERNPLTDQAPGE